METYHKIQTLFKRDLNGFHGKKGRMIEGAWTTPELEYLANNEWEFTEKVDGTNIRIHYRPVVAGVDGYGPVVEFAGRTDRAVIPEHLLSHLDDTFTTERFHEAFPNADASGVILFGEGYGPKIQDGGKYRDDHSFVLFDVKVGGWWLSRANVDDIANKLGIDSVPVLGYGTLQDAIDIVRWQEQMSEWGNFVAEGIVARPTVPMFDRKGERIITKIKAVDFR